MYQVYQVMAGDTLKSISNDIGITEDLLKILNGFPQNKEVSVGEVIVIPVTNGGYFNNYVVKKGDTIYEIARKYNVDYEDLLLINGLSKEEFIYPNQEIIIPKSDVLVYVTKDNDTLKDVYSKWQIPVSELVKYNEKIYLLPDQMLVYKKG